MRLIWYRVVVPLLLVAGAVVLFVVGVFNLSRILLSFGHRNPAVAIGVGFGVVIGVGLLAVLTTAGVRRCFRSKAAPLLAALVTLFFGGLAGTEALEALTEEKESSAVAPPVTQTFVAADAGFEAAAVRMLAGARRVELVNEGSEVHTLRIEGQPDFRLEAAPGASAPGTVDLGSGIYAFFCEVPGHRERGLRGTVVVAGAVRSR